MIAAAMLGKRSIFLVGPMGSGKTAVGRHLARMLRFTFHDSDADIEAKTGVDIPFIFEKEGEAGIQNPRKGVHRPADALANPSCWPRAAAR